MLWRFVNKWNTECCRNERKRQSQAEGDKITWFEVQRHMQSQAKEHMVALFEAQQLGQVWKRGVIAELFRYHIRKRKDMTTSRKDKILNFGRNAGQGCLICQGDTSTLQGDASATNHIQQKE